MIIIKRRSQSNSQYSVIVIESGAMTSTRFCLLPSIWVFCSLVTLGSVTGTTVPKVKLSDGNEMPIVGFGTHFRTPTQEEEAFLSALEVGYRSFDTAYIYNNEKHIGATLKKWFAKGGKREDLFISTKLPPQGMNGADVKKFLKISLENLGLDYLDMYLIHMPFGFNSSINNEWHIDENADFVLPTLDFTTDHIAVWKQMEEQVKAGRVKSIGLSNVNETQILNIYNNAEIKPSNVQVELNIYLQQEKMRKLCEDLNIVLTAYSPLGSNDLVHLRRRKRSVTLPAPIRHPLVQEIAAKYGKSTGQILLKYTVQNGVAVIPKSGNPKRQRDNFELFDFELSNEDMARLKTLDQQGRVRKFSFLSFLGVENHPQYPWSYLIQ